MAYGSTTSSKMIVKIKKNLPKKMKRKAMLNGLMIRSYAKNKNFLTDAMVKRLREHSKHHSIRHMRSMVYKMETLGMSFSKSHEETMKKYGK
tara:strand:+ start:500 stop:775 length:276 start_codon:yes stop_codon:yes gene_type:complete